MKKESKIELDEYLGVDGIYCNSELVSYQKRSRFYWTNWSWDLPEEKKKPKVKIEALETFDTFMYCGHKFRFLGYTKYGNYVNAEMIGYEGKYATFSVGTEVEKV